MHQPRRWIAAVLTLLVVAPPACTGSDPDAGPGNPPPGTGSDASVADVGPGPSSTPDATVEAAPPQCTAPLADCNADGRCDTSLDTDPANCGECGFSCEGGQCKAGKCQVQMLVDRLSGPVSVAVNKGALVVLAGGGPLVCPKSGCGGEAPAKLETDQLVPDGPHTLVVDDTHAYWLAREGAGTRFALWKCEIAGCGLAPSELDEEQAGTELHADGLFALRYDPMGGKIRKVSLDRSTAPQYFERGSIPPALYFALAGGKMAYSNTDGAAGGARGVYYGDFTDAAPDRLMSEGMLVAIANGFVYATRVVDGSSDAIFGCAVGGCGGAGERLGNTGAASGTGKILDLKADASGVYWVERQGTTGRIMRCAVPGCPRGPEVLAGGQDAPVSLALDERFVYWVNAGSGSNGSVFRVAK